MYDQFNQICNVICTSYNENSATSVTERERKRYRDGNFKFKTDNLNKSFINNDIFNLKYKLWHLRQ